MQSASKTHFPSVIQLVVSGFGLFLYGGSAAGLFIAALVSVLGNGLEVGDVYPMLSMAWTALAVSLLLIPSLVSALLRLMGRDNSWLRIRNGLRVSSLFMLGWPLLVLLGHYLSKNNQLSSFLVPPIQVLAIAIPLWWFLEVGRNSLRGNDPQRNWGVLSVSLVITPTVIILIELVLLIILGIAGIVWLSSQPQLLEELNRVAQRLMSAELDPETTLRILRPYLQQPLVLYAIFAVASGFIPLIEELFKPLALWGLASRRFMPADGFVSGLICGAGFALIESLGMLSSAAVGMDWAASVTARMGTGLLHMVTTGIVGYGLASAWSRERYLRLGVIFIIAVVLHGIWNFFAILLGIMPALEGPAIPTNLTVLARLSAVAPAALVILGIVMFLILVGANRRLRQDADTPVIE